MKFEQNARAFYNCGQHGRLACLLCTILHALHAKTEKYPRVRCVLCLCAYMRSLCLLLVRCARAYDTHRKRRAQSSLLICHALVPYEITHLFVGMHNSIQVIEYVLNKMV